MLLCRARDQHCLAPSNGGYPIHPISIPFWVSASCNCSCCHCNRVQPRGGPHIGICNEVQKSLEIIGSTPQGHTCPECWQLWPFVGGDRNGAAEDHWSWDLNQVWQPFGISFWDHTPFQGTCSLGESQAHAALEVLLFATWMVLGA